MLLDVGEYERLIDELKYRGGTAPCARCGRLTACEFLHGEDRMPVCPPCIKFLHEHPEERPTDPLATDHWLMPGRSLTERRQAAEFGAAVEALSAELAEVFPDPVDVFEDDLASKHGLERHPELTQAEWRRLRVRFIEQADP